LHCLVIEGENNVNKKYTTFFFGFVCLPVSAILPGYFDTVLTWEQIEMNAEVVKYSEGNGYAFSGVFLPFFQGLKNIKRLRIIYLFISGLIGLTIVPYLVDYITEERLIAKGYTYCEAERIGSVRHIERT